MLAIRNPWQMWDLEREVNDLFRRFFGTDLVTPFGLLGSNVLAQQGWTPAVDVLSRDGDLVVRAELPGIDPEKDVEIFVENGRLHLRGERRHEERTNGESYYRVESTFGAFERTIALPEGVNAEDIAADYHNGVLEVVVPKAAELTSGKRIPISVGTGRTALSAKGRRK